MIKCPCKQKIFLQEAFNMCTIKCFDIVETVTDEATARFSPIFHEHEERKTILKQYCEAIDTLCELYRGESIEVGVNEIKMTISIRMEFQEIRMEPENKLFLQLAERTTTLIFSPNENGNSIIIEFVFPSIWEHI